MTSSFNSSMSAAAEPLTPRRDIVAAAVTVARPPLVQPAVRRRRPRQCFASPIRLGCRPRPPIATWWKSMGRTAPSISPDRPASTRRRRSPRRHCHAHQSDQSFERPSSARHGGAARAMGLSIQFLNARNEAEIDAEFATIARMRFGALVVGAEASFQTLRQQIVALATRHAMTLSMARHHRAGGQVESHAARMGELLRSRHRQQGVPNVFHHALDAFLRWPS